MVLLVVLLALVSSSCLASLSPIVWPGLNQQPTFNSYGGYVTVDASVNRSLFFMFSESQRSPKDDPVVLWLTGGPGCSSLLAFLSENGPFRPNPQNPLNLIHDDYAWNRVANVIWLESPAGVGFSYSDNPIDYTTVGDARTANDTYIFLQTFFQKLFPQFAGNRFYITGESYGGHYVPTAAERVFQGNSVNATINLVGILEGNAWTFMPLDNQGAIDTWRDRMIVPADQVAAVKAHCNLSYVGPLHKLRDSQCDEAINAAMDHFSYVNIYDIYVDVCQSNHLLKQLAKVSWFHAKLYNVLTARQQRRAGPPLPPFDPCSDNHLSEYLNNLDVQKAIGAVPPTATHPIQWNECSNVVNYDFNDVATSVVPVLERLMARPNFHALVYSGDVDAIVPTAGTLNWINTLNQTVKVPWKVWLDENKQAGGFVTVYDRFTFTTIRNAGHMCPQYQPARTFQVFNSWLSKHQIN